MKLPSIITFAEEKVEEAYYKLEKGDESERELCKLISQALQNIEENAFCGVQVPKRLIPKEYVRKYKVNNLWKYDLPRGWRLLYSILKEEIQVVALILEWFSHKDYEKRFKY